MYNNDLFQNMNMESNITGNNNYINNEMDVNVKMNNFAMPSNDMNNSPVMSPRKEKCIHRTFVHEVPQDCFFMIEK